MLEQWGRVRAETSAECWRRLASQVPWVNISRNSLFDLLCDAQPATWPGTGAVRLEIAGQKVEFRGQLPTAEPQQKLVFRFAAEAPGMAWAQDQAGRVLGTLTRVDRIGFNDADALREAAEFKAVALARGIQDLRMFDANNPDTLRELEDTAQAAHLMSAFEGAHARPVPVATLESETSNDLARAATGRHTPDAPASGAAAFLAHL